jgi:hypothetical protein
MKSIITPHNARLLTFNPMFRRLLEIYRRLLSEGQLSVARKVQGICGKGGEATPEVEDEQGWWGAWERKDS